MMSASCGGAAPPTCGSRSGRAASNDSGAQLRAWDDTYLIYSQDRFRTNGWKPDNDLLGY
eukprot:COSAG06_NODE_44240_length_365_cov_0.736842_1_plen_59_part_10